MLADIIRLPMSETDVVLNLFMHWLTHAHERSFRVAERSEMGAVATDGAARLAVEARSLLPLEDAGWAWRRCVSAAARASP